MITQQKATGRATSIPSGLAAGAAVSMIVTVVVCGLGAWLIASELMPQKQIGYCSIAALLLSAVLGGMTAIGRVKRKKLTVSLLNGGIYYGILIAVTILFFDGSFQGMGVTLAVILMGSLAAVLLANRKSNHRNNVRRKKIRR